MGLAGRGGRAIVQRTHIQWGFVKWIAAGAVIGTIVGGQFASLLPERLFTAAGMGLCQAEAPLTDSQVEEVQP